MKSLTQEEKRFQSSPHSFSKFDTTEICRQMQSEMDRTKEILIREAFLRRDIPLWDLRALVGRGQMFIWPDGSTVLEIDGEPALQWRVKDFQIEYDFIGP